MNCLVQEPAEKRLKDSKSNILMHKIVCFFNNSACRVGYNVSRYLLSSPFYTRTFSLTIVFVMFLCSCK